LIFGFFDFWICRNSSNFTDQGSSLYLVLGISWTSGFEETAAISLIRDHLCTWYLVLGTSWTSGFAEKAAISLISDHLCTLYLVPELQADRLASTSPHRKNFKL
jgi:hypothetical protein